MCGRFASFWVYLPNIWRCVFICVNEVTHEYCLKIIMDKTSGTRMFSLQI